MTERNFTSKHRNCLHIVLYRLLQMNDDDVVSSSLPDLVVEAV